MKLCFASTMPKAILTQICMFLMQKQGIFVLLKRAAEVRNKKSDSWSLTPFRA